MSAPTHHVEDSTVRWMFVLGGWGFSTLAVALGLTIVLQSETRMSNPSWTVALSFGGADFWGGWMIVFGLLMITAMALGKRGSEMMMLASVAVSFAIFGRFMASIDVIADTQTSLTNPPVWFALTCVYLAQGIVHSRAFESKR